MVRAAGKVVVLMPLRGVRERGYGNDCPNSWSNPFVRVMPLRFPCRWRANRLVVQGIRATTPYLIVPSHSTPALYSLALTLSPRSWLDAGPGSLTQTDRLLTLHP